MTQLAFPGLKFNGLSLTRGQLLDVSLLGVGLVIPPWDITLVPELTFWEPFIIFDSDWIMNALSDAFMAIPKAVWDYFTNVVEFQIEEYFKVHPERKPK